MLSHNSQNLNNIPNRAKQRIHVVDMHGNDSVITCNTMIPSILNNPKKIHLSTTIFNSYYSTYFDDRNDGFEVLYKQYTSIFVNNIDHPYLIKEFKQNKEMTDYERKLKREFYKLPWRKNWKEAFINNFGQKISVNKLYSASFKVLWNTQIIMQRS